MLRLGITSAFARYGATLRNPQWSVSAWAPNGSLVVSIWEHHYQKGQPGTMEFTDSPARWSGDGNREFRANLARAHACVNCTCKARVVDCALNRRACALGSLARAASHSLRRCDRPDLRRTRRRSLGDVTQRL